MSKSPEEKLKKAKEFFDMGIMDKAEFESIKQECFVALGIRKPQVERGSSLQTPLPPSRNIESSSLVTILHDYSKENRGDWLSQQSGRLLGYLLDYLSPKVDSRTIRVFMSLSYDERLLYHLIHSDKISLQQHYSALCQTYHPNLVSRSLEVWEKVLGKKSGFQRISQEKEKGFFWSQKV